MGRWAGATAAKANGWEEGAAAGGKQQVGGSWRWQRGGRAGAKEEEAGVPAR